MDTKRENPAHASNDEDNDLLLVVGPVIAVAIAAGIWLFIELIHLIKLLSTPSAW